MRRIALIFLLISSNVAMSQDSIKLYYNQKWEVTKKAKANYYRDVEYDLNSFKLDGKVTDYTMAGKLIMTGFYSNGKRNGKFHFFYTNEKLKSQGHYKKGERIGIWKYFYRNGKLKQKILFKKRTHFRNIDFSVIEFYDKSGLQLIKNGLGEWKNDSVYIVSHEYKGLTRVSGTFKDSLKHGIWKSYRISDNKLLQKEKFKNNELCSSIMYNPQQDNYWTMSSEFMTKLPDEYIGKFRNTEQFKLDNTEFDKSLLNSNVETIFTSITGKKKDIKNRKAGYLHGDHEMLAFISKNIKYPLSCLKKRISGKVYISVIINPDGTTKEINVLRGANSDLNKEAVRVASLIKAWLPELREGTALESKITIPIRFSVE